MSDPEKDLDEEAPEGRVLSVHMGPSANCSSIGSFVDFLFVSSVVGGAVLSAVAVMLQRERARQDREEPADDASTDADDEER